jgi:hypothetical protein
LCTDDQQIIYCTIVATIMCLFFIYTIFIIYQSITPSGVRGIGRYSAGVGFSMHFQYNTDKYIFLPFHIQHLTITQLLYRWIYSENFFYYFNNKKISKKIFGINRFNKSRYIIKVKLLTFCPLTVKHGKKTKNGTSNEERIATSVSIIRENNV